MKRLFPIALLACLLATGPARAQDDGLGLYFSQSEFSLFTAAATNVPGFALASYIVLTAPSGDVITGYEVGIASTAADFAIPLTSLFFDTNLGTNVNQRVTFAVPKPALPGGTLLSAAFLTTGSLLPETISFGPSSPSSLRCCLPVVFYAGTGPVVCSYPHGTPDVAWLNGAPVPGEPRAWGDVKAMFR
ncbi:hypothetical protein FJ250_01300 [bacterium]|nr:hypothetical protein [bacterium]